MKAPTRHLDGGNAAKRSYRHDPDGSRGPDRPVRSAGRKPSARVPLLLAKSQIIGALTVDMNGTITGCNAAFSRMLGYPSTESLSGLSLIDELLINSDCWDSWINAKAEILQVDVELRAYGGGEILARGDVRVRRDRSKQPVGIEAILVDVTELPRTDSIVEGGSTLHALGALTSGIAHDFNNLLTVIVGNLYLLVEGVRGDESLSKKAKVARDAAKRGADLTAKLLSFARRESGTPKDIDVAPAISNVQSLLDRVLGPGIKLSSEVQENLWPIRVDVAQLESAIINLAVNARDAMVNGGKLLIRAKNVTLGTNDLVGELDSGDYVCISVTDNGSGIPREIKDRVFEPFFSTKVDRGGSGLGLSMVRQFVAQSGGAVDIRSKEGKGTEVRLLLPRLHRDHSDTLAVTETSPLSTLATGDEAILVSSSDPHVRSTACEVLHVLGYSTAVVSNPRELNSTLQSRHFDLLISDVEPRLGLSASKILAMARRTKSNTAVVLMTDRAISKSPSDRTKTAVLIKPFTLDDVATTVRNILDSRSQQ